jgi:hypothetical protein
VSYDSQSDLAPRSRFKCIDLFLFRVLLTFRPDVFPPFKAIRSLDLIIAGASSR